MAIPPTLPTFRSAFHLNVEYTLFSLIHPKCNPKCHFGTLNLLKWHFGIHFSQSNDCNLHAYIDFLIHSLFPAANY